MNFARGLPHLYHRLSKRATQLGSMTTHARPGANETQVLVCIEGGTESDFARPLIDAGMNVVTLDKIEDPSTTQFAVVWKHPRGALKRFPNLKGIQVAGAGVDSALNDREFPRNVPVARLVDPVMSDRMAHWVLWGVLNSQRDMDFYYKAQMDQRWEGERQAEFFRLENLSVGIMGLGVIGTAVASKLRAAGYSVRGWSRTLKSVEGVDCFHGKDQLQDFLKESNVLVCLLPLTEDTRGIVTRKVLSTLPRGSTFINGGRGDHAKDEDLLWALGKGHIKHCILDVFSEEPLPKSSALWTHPGVRITPHVAAITSIPTSIDQIMENYRRCMKGEKMLNTVDFDLGY